MASNVLSLALAGWIGVRYLRLALEVSGFEVAAVLARPPLWLYGLICACTAAVAGFVLLRLVQRAPRDDRAFRLLPINAVFFSAVHFFGFPPYLAGDHRVIVSAQLQLLEMQAAELFGDGLPEDAEELRAAIEYPPPFLRFDVPMERWNLVVHQDCAGPLREAPAGVETGTLLYCLASARDVAWITAVGVAGERTGPPAVMDIDHEPLVAVLRRQVAVPAMWEQFPDGGLSGDTAPEGN